MTWKGLDKDSPRVVVPLRQAPRQGLCFCGMASHPSMSEDEALETLVTDPMQTGEGLDNYLKSKRHRAFDVLSHALRELRTFRAIAANPPPPNTEDEKP